MKKLSIALIVITLIFSSRIPKTFGQGNYMPPQDSLVKINLEKWQDLKFGLIMHWGLYSQLGIVESWGLCSEDQSFQDRDGMDYTDYKEMYFGLIKKFNPTEFNPEIWAAAAKNAGMKYVIFTTKHHDGFCMFDTKQTDFKITSEDCPFSTNPKANVTKEILNAFRKDGFMVGTYFSKPDWHSPNYWNPTLATPNRSNNYDVRKYPDRWKAFQNYTYNQINELTTEYGRIDILWLDGGWVRPDSTINEEVKSWGYDIPKWEQDINMPRIAAMARKNQAGIIIADRTVHGPYEDYRTPEQTVPDKILPYPWESNMTLTQGWGHSYHPNYKSAEFIVKTLIDVVSKGGNFLLNVAPTPQGTFEKEALNRLEEIGKWMKINGEGIYGSKPYFPYHQGDSIQFTQSKNGKFLYVFLLKWSGDTISLSSLKISGKHKVEMLGSKQKIKSIYINGIYTILLPKVFQNKESRPSPYYSVLKVTL